MKRPQKLSLSIAALLAAAGAAHASSFADPAPDCGSGCSNPPISAAPSNEEFSLSLAESLFQKGTVPTMDQLVGTWMNVGVATVPGNTSELTDGYNLQGLKNSDGSPQFSLEFVAPKVIGQDFGGRPIVQPGSVTFSNLGSQGLHQGPNDILFNNEDNDACFAQYTYSMDGTLDKSHGNYECRFLATDSKKMICSVTLILDPSEISSSDPDSQAWNGKVEVYLAYIKN